MVTAWPFFTYYGGKWRIAKKYPAPKHDILIEPFAGSAGYAVKWQHPNVRLYDLNEKVIGVWRYLIELNELELKDLPEKIDHVDNLKICIEAVKRGEIEARLDHPCKETCSGWKQGREQGHLDMKDRLILADRMASFIKNRMGFLSGESKKDASELVEKWFGLKTKEKIK